MQLDAQGIDRERIVAQAWMLDDKLSEKAARLGELFLDWVAERAPRL